MINELDVRSQIIFSHRPDLGISLGVFVDQGRAYLGMSFCRTKADVFNRKMANGVIVGRITKMAQGFEIPFTHSVPTTKELSPYDIVSTIRPWFKSIGGEFDLTRPNGRRISAEEARKVLIEEFDYVVESLCNRVNV